MSGRFTIDDLKSKGFEQNSDGTFQKSNSVKKDFKEEIKPKKNKLSAQKSSYDGKIFDSKKEAAYCAELDIKKKIGEVVAYERQVRYDIVVNGNKICFYKLDFKVKYSDGKIEHIDVKGYKKGCTYSLFRLKKKLVEAFYGIKILEK